MAVIPVDFWKESKLTSPEALWQDHFIARHSVAEVLGIGAVPAGFRCAANCRNGS
jgi:hypothetical protein